MGFYDRPYLRSGPRSQSYRVGGMRPQSVTTWLIVINVAVYLINEISGGVMARWGYFSADTFVHRLQLWRFITFQFLHAGPGHLFFNMLTLYFFGQLVEGWLTPRRFLAFYLLCGIAGAATYLILWQVGFLSIYGAKTPLVGASAGIFGVLIAAARLAPNTTVMLLFPPIPVKLKVLALILLGIAVWMVLVNGPNAGGQAAHLGGAAMGALLIARPKLLNGFAHWTKRRKTRRFFD